MRRRYRNHKRYHVDNRYNQHNDDDDNFDDLDDLDQFVNRHNVEHDRYDVEFK